MTIDGKLLEILACPETKETVAPADETLIAKINAAIEAGTLHNRGGEKISEQIDAGLLRGDKKFLYPIRDDIPIMLIDEAIPVEGWN
ncbi:MAG: hypothetical protein GY801_00210 [bacterium]|nr:hypothetical protein [bacterium]